jgi:hypothetical protein
MFGAGIRGKAMPYVTTEIAGEMELFPAPRGQAHNFLALFAMLTTT